MFFSVMYLYAMAKSLLFIFYEYFFAGNFHKFSLCCDCLTTHYLNNVYVNINNNANKCSHIAFVIMY